MAQNNCTGLENGMLQHQSTAQQHYNSPKKNYRTGRMQQPLRHRINSPPAPEPHTLMARPSHERPQRTRTGSKWATIGGGPGMQAIFLGHNRTCGTGVFLPRIEGSGDAQLLTNKPAYSPVLLPSRVVQTLKLNVHEVGKQLKPQTDQPRNSAKRNENSKTSKKLEVEYISPDIYLPKEWTY